MERVLVIGCPGSGKSTFSRALAAKTGLPLCHLDRLFWNADKTTVPAEVFDARLEEVLRQPRGIIDGNYSRTLPRRLAWCDTVFFLDFPAAVCLDGVRARRGKPRPDMPWIETEQDEEFMQYIADFAAQQRPKLLALLRECPDKRVVAVSSREQLQAYL